MRKTIDKSIFEKLILSEKNTLSKRNIKLNSNVADKTAKHKKV